MSKITTGQIAELIAQSDIGKVTRETFQAFLNLKRTYFVTVDLSMLLEEMIASGQYDSCNKDINSENFPIKGTGALEVNLELVHLGRKATTDEVEAELDKRGLRAATLVELLAFGAKYPELQREFPIIALGSVWRYHDGFRGVPFLLRRGSLRDLGLFWDGDGWDGSCRFLAVRK